MKKFPILGTCHWIPWEMIATHEKTAKDNHSGQSLKRLAERCGLSFVEAYAVLTDTHWHDSPNHVDEEFAQTEINKMMRSSSVKITKATKGTEDMHTT